MSHDLIVIGPSGIPIYATKVDPDSLLKSGFFKAIYDFGRQQKSFLSRIEFLNRKCSYCHFFKQKNLLFFITIDAFYFKKGIILKMKRLYNEIFKDIEPSVKGDITPDKEVIKRVKEILLEKFVKQQILAKQDHIRAVCEEILKAPEIKTISIHTIDNTPVFFTGSDIDTLKKWLFKWNLANPPAPYEFEFGNYLDEKSLQGIVMNSGISLKSDDNFILYYIFGEATNLGFHMDWLSARLNKLIG